MFCLKTKDSEGHEVTVEVTEEVYQVFQNYERIIDNQNHEQRRHWNKRYFDGDMLASADLTEDQVCLFEILKNVLKTCTKSQKSRFYLYFQGYSLTEIAQIQHRDISTIKESISAVQGKIKKYL